MDKLSETNRAQFEACASRAIRLGFPLGYDFVKDAVERQVASIVISDVARRSESLYRQGQS